MIQSNFHIHSTFCDGKNTLQEMAKAAFGGGLKSIGFTSHYPLKYTNDWTMKPELLPEYIKEINALKESYAGKMEIYLGIEADFYMDTQLPSDTLAENRSQFDYIIGSIHTMGTTTEGEEADLDDAFDSFMDGLTTNFDGNGQLLAEAYYDSIIAMTKILKPDIIGHLDLLKIHNAEGRFFNEMESWYKDSWMAALDAIQKSGAIVEVNTGGIARFGKEYIYPAIAILKEISRRKIPITINADSHKIENLQFYYDKVESLLYSLGFRYYQSLAMGKWVETPLSK